MTDTANDIIQAPPASPFYRIPTKEAFDACFASHSHDVEMAYKILLGEVDPCEVSESTDRWRRSCYNSPSDIDLSLHAIDALVGTHGVEAIGVNDERDVPIFDYLNVGDTYVSTLLHCDGDAVIRCYGDAVEHIENGGCWEDFVLETAWG